MEKKLKIYVFSSLWFVVFLLASLVFLLLSSNLGANFSFVVLSVASFFLASGLLLLLWLAKRTLKGFQTFQTYISDSLSMVVQGKEVISNSQGGNDSFIDDVNISFKILFEQRNVLLKLHERINEHAKDLGLLLNKMQNNADTVVSNVVDTTKNSEELHSELTAIVESNKEMRETFHGNLTKISSSTEIICETVNNTQKAQEVMRLLSHSSENIGNITQIISDIAAKTSLLSLNATIEAVSAGDAGKGFSVVASEVKELASRTAAATGDIAKSVEEIQNTVKQSVQMISEISALIQNVDEISSEIGTSLQNHCQTVDEITENLVVNLQGADDTKHKIKNAMGDCESIKTITDEAHALSDQLEGFINDYARYLKACAASQIQRDRRKAGVRFEVKQLVRIKKNNICEDCEIKNISVGGAAIVNTKLASALCKGEDVQFVLQGFPHTIMATVQAVTDGSVLRLQFNIEDAVQNKLGEYLMKISDLRAAS